MDNNIREVQNQLLDMLTELVEFFDKHNITYYLGAGTLLGAYRNQKFIPWDDDIDLIMDRDNYELFIEKAKEDLDNRFFLQCDKTNSNWYYPYAKVRKEGTVYSTAFTSVFKDMHEGLFIDIFVHDKTASNRLGEKIHISQIRLLKSIIKLKWFKKNRISYNTNIITKTIGLFFSLDRAVKCLSKCLQRYRHKDTHRMIDSTGMHLKNGSFDDRIFGKPQKCMFENNELSIPTEAEKYLIFLYGEDFMIPKEYKHEIKKVNI